MGYNGEEPDLDKTNRIPEEVLIGARFHCQFTEVTGIKYARRMRSLCKDLTKSVNNFV